MGWHVGFANATGIRARGMEKSAAGACGALYDFLGENQKIVGIVVVLFPDHVDETGPTVAEANNLIAFMKRTNGNAANCGIQTGDVPAAGENANDAFFGVDVCHDAEPLPRNSEPTIIHGPPKLRKCG